MDVPRSAAPFSSHGQSAMDDMLSPFFLHHSDGPGAVIISGLLNGDNYASWSRSMILALSLRNKMGFVDGSIPRPSSEDPSLLVSWIRNNNLVISWILNSVSKDIYASIVYSESAHAIWIDLRDRFQQSNGPRMYQLRRDLLSLHQQNDSTVVYFTRLKTIWDELGSFRPVCTCGKCLCGGVKELSSYYQMEYTMAFLMGLNDSFSHVRGQILLMDPLPPINKVFSFTSLEEHQGQIGSSSADLSSHMGVSAKLDASGAPLKPGFKANKEERPYCTHCNRHGHTIEKCYKLHGFPPGYKPRSLPSEIKFGGRVIYSRTLEEVERATEKLLHFVEAKKRKEGQCVLGLDIEWRPTFQRGVAPGKAAVMQICGDNNSCYVLHIIHSQIPQKLQCLLEDPASLKVGVGIANDAAKVLLDHSVSINNLEDLSDLANQKLGGEPKKWSLSTLTEMLICKKVAKPNKIRLGNWEVEGLSKEQLNYAATDAYVSWYLYQVLKNLPNPAANKSLEMAVAHK